MRVQQKVPCDSAAKNTRLRLIVQLGQKPEVLQAGRVCLLQGPDDSVVEATAVSWDFKKLTGATKVRGHAVCDGLLLECENLLASRLNSSGR
eukprot:494213-Pleurochrysis_carterae.AAC.2